MALDASIYQTLRPVQAPSYAEAQQKAMTVSNLAMQQARGMKQMEREDKDAELAERKRRLGAIGQVYDGLAGMNEQDRAKAWGGARQSLIEQGALKPEDAPEQYDPGHFRQSWTTIQKPYYESDEYIDRKYKQAQIAALGAKTNQEYNPAKVAFDRLPPENQKQIEQLATKSANKSSIKNQIDSALQILDNPEISEDQKITAGQGLLKVLNSSEGADAIGAEESKRLGGLLEYKVANFTQPGSFIGRDLGEFVNQVKLKSQELGQGVARNRSEMDTLYGRKGADVPAIEVPEGAKDKGGVIKRMADSLSGGSEAKAAAPIKHGHKEDGYVFIGGDPADQKNWKRAK